MAIDPQDYRKVLCVKDTHQLELADTRIRTANKVERRSHLLRELDAEHNLVAHYRIWTHHSGVPPFKEQRGWEKYAPDGTLLDREVRYSQQPVGTLIH